MNNKNTVVITGGTRGFGLELARCFVDAGYQVMISSRSQTNLDNALISFSDNKEIQGVICDVTDLDSVEEMAQKSIDTFGSIDIWINNAGISGPYGPTAKIPPEMFKKVTDTNILGTYYGSFTAIQHFRAQSSGLLINILGMGYKGPAPFQNAYGASKNWIRVFTESLSKEIKEEGENFQVFSYQPGMMRTDLILSIDVIDGYQEKVAVFPKVVEFLAVDTHKPASHLVQLVSHPGKKLNGKTLRYGSMLKLLFNVFRKREEIEIPLNPIEPFS